MSSRNCCWLEHFKELDKRSILWKVTSCPLSAAQGVKDPFEGHPCARTAWPSPVPKHLSGFWAGLVPHSGEAGSHIHNPVSGWITLSYHKQPWRQHYIEVQPAVKGDFVPVFPLDQHAASTAGASFTSLCGLAVSFCWEKQKSF